MYPARAMGLVAADARAEKAALKNVMSILSLSLHRYVSKLIQYSIHAHDIYVYSCASQFKRILLFSLAGIIICSDSDDFLHHINVF